MLTLASTCELDLQRVRIWCIAGSRAAYRLRVASHAPGCVALLLVMRECRCRFRCEIEKCTCKDRRDGRCCWHVLGELGSDLINVLVRLCDLSVQDSATVDPLLS